MTQESQPVPIGDAHAGVVSVAGAPPPGVAPSDATDEDELAPEHLRMADALDEIAKPLARGSASIVRRAAEMLRTRGVQPSD